VLDWLYVDAQRIVFRTSLYGLSAEMLTSLSEQRLMLMPMLYDANGEMLNASMGGGGGDPAPSDPAAHLFIGSMEFVSTLPSDVPLNITLELTISEQVGANFEALHTFRFPIHAQPAAPRVFEVYETQEINGIAVTLNTVTFTPSLVSMYICYEMPPDSNDWQADATIRVDGQDSWWITSMSHGEFFTTDEGEDGRCITLKYLAPYRDDGSGLVTSTDPQTLSILVDRLFASPPETLTEERKARAHQRLAEQGIEVEFDIAQGSMGWTVISAPAGMPEWEIGRLVYDALSDLYDGPWEFNIPLN
jgi:hypothetical protein